MRTNAEKCPKCGANLQGAPIPEKDRENFGATHFSLKIGVYDREKDCTVAWVCPFCKYSWSR